MVDVTPLMRRDAKVIQSYKAERFKVSGQSYETAIIIFPDAVLEWPVTDVSNLTINDFKPLISRASDVEVLLLGCGAKGVFIPPSLKQGLKKHGIILDAMDTGAACRTYNVLMAEGRLVTAALLPFMQ